ncbi:MAG: hypothetical protein ACOZB3_02035 [Calditrichota bacterium]
MWFRLILIVVAVYLVARYLLRIFSTPRSADHVKGQPQSSGSKVDRDRIQDANFKDIKDHET